MKNNMTSDVNNTLYVRVRKFLNRVNNLPNIYLSEYKNNEEREQAILNEANMLYEELNTIKSSMNINDENSINL